MRTYSDFIQAFEYGDGVWSATGVPARQIDPVALARSWQEYDPRDIPIPRTHDYSIQIRIEPRDTSITSGQITIDGVPFETTVGQSTVGATTLYASIRQGSNIFTMGATHSIGVQVSRQGGAPSSVTRVITSGSSNPDDPGTIGYSDYSNRVYGSISSDVLFTRSGVTYRARYIESSPRSADWGFSGGLFHRSYNPPFWAEFVRTIEEAGGEGLEPEVPVSPTPDMLYADFTIVAQDGYSVDPWGDIESLITGYDFLRGIGSASHRLLEFGDTASAIMSVSYLYLALRVNLEAVSGATFAFIDLGDGPRRCFVADSPGAGTELFIPMLESPFAAGNTYTVRIYLDGDLSGPVVSDYIQHEAEFAMHAGNDGFGENYIGYASHGIGSLNPANLTIGDRVLPIQNIVDNRRGGRSIEVGIERLRGVARLMVSIDGGSPTTLDRYRDDQYGLGASATVSHNVFATGNNYTVRLYIEGFLRDSVTGAYFGGGGWVGPDPDPDPGPDPSDGIVMLAGAHATMPGIGYASMFEMGGVDSDTLQVGGQTGTLMYLLYDYEVGELVMAVDNLNGITSITLRIDGGEALTLSLTPDHTMWTAALAESPFVDGQSYHLDLNIEAGEEPGEGDQYADFELGAGTESGGGWVAVGFMAGQAGTLQPENPVIGGITGSVYAIAYDVGDGVLFVEVDGIWGVDAWSLSISGGDPIPISVEPGPHGVIGEAVVAESPFVPGQTYELRLNISGNLRDTE